MSGEPIPARDVAARLGARLLGSRSLPGGVSARVEALELAMPDGSRTTVVVRAHGTAGWKSKAVDLAAREFRLLGWLSQRGVPVPEPLALDAKAGWFVMAFVPGGTAVTEPLAAARRAAETLRRIHELAAVPDDLEELEDPVQAAPEFLPRARLDLVSLMARVQSRARRRVCHGDFWPGNWLWRGEELVAVVDWEDARLGDPLSDVAAARVELACTWGGRAAEAFTASYFGERQAPLRLAVWEVYVSAAALATLERWGLPPGDEARRRACTDAFFERAALDLQRGAAGARRAPRL